MTLHVLRYELYILSLRIIYYKISYNMIYKYKIQRKRETERIFSTTGTTRLKNAIYTKKLLSHFITRAFNKHFPKICCRLCDYQMLALSA